MFFFLGWSVYVWYQKQVVGGGGARRGTTFLPSVTGATADGVVCWPLTGLGGASSGRRRNYAKLQLVSHDGLMSSFFPLLEPVISKFIRQVGVHLKTGCSGTKRVVFKFTQELLK